MKYKINDRTITVRKGSIAHKTIEHLPLLAMVGTATLALCIYALVVIWAGLLA